MTKPSRIRGLAPNQWLIIHNPRCSKSRGALEILEQRQTSPQVLEYLKDPLSKEELSDLLSVLGLPVEQVVRKKETLWQELALDGAGAPAVLEAVAAHPQLLERPIVLHGTRGVVARPLENCLGLF